jgi:hypothetical protein
MHQSGITCNDGIMRLGEGFCHNRPRKFLGEGNTAASRLAVLAETRPSRTQHKEQAESL